MKKTLLLLLLSSLLFLSCSTDSGDPVVEYLPSVGTVSNTRFILPSPTSTEDLYYAFMTPILYKLEKNNGIQSVGDSYNSTHPILGNITFEITVDKGDFIYTGSNDDNSFRIVVTYSPSSKTFSFIQSGYMYDADNLNPGPPAVPGDFYAYITSDVMDINTDLSFHGSYKFLGIMDFGASKQYMTYPAVELYHGFLATNNDLGTGIAIRKNAMLSDGGSGYTFLPDGTGKPSLASHLQDLTRMDAYVEEVGSVTTFYDAAVADTTNGNFGEYNMLIWRSSGSNTVTLLPADPNAALDYSDFKSLYPDVWEANILITE